MPLLTDGKQELATVEERRELTVLEIIQAVAADPRADVEKLERLLAMQERIQARDAERLFNVAMKSAQEQMRPVVRDAKNDSTGSRYARLETVDAKMRPVYTRHGFSLSFNSSDPKTEGALRITCRVLHEAGHSKDYELEGALDTAGPRGTQNKTSIQGLGSSASYLRRYLTLMIFNVVLANEDKDGQRQQADFISPEQKEHILDMMHELGMDPAATSKFLTIVNAKSVGEIKPDVYRTAMTLLEAKRRKGSE